ncbi:MAG: PAS domain S-box protein [Candidatus Melainabacteria bacterium]|nr:PAS domain S-box protein [Candidatus Melainabacteria bacterium]
MSDFGRVLKSGLARNAMLLGVLIFASNVVFFFALLGSFSKLEESLHQQQEARLVVGCLAQFSSAMQVATFALIDRTRTAKNSENRYAAIFLRLPAYFAELKHSLRDHPEDELQLSALSLALDEAIDLVHRVDVSYWMQYNFGLKVRHMGYCADLVKVTNKISDLLRRLDDKYRGLEGTDDSIGLSSAGALSKILLLALVANTAFTVLSFLLVIFLILRRIKTISLSAINNGLDKPLMPYMHELSDIEFYLRELSVHLSSLKSREALVLEHAADFICLLDQRGIVLSVSESSAQLLGYQAADLVGRRLNSLVEPSDAEALLLALKSLSTIEEGATRFESRVRLGAGEKRDFSFRAKLSPDKTIVCVAHDVTEKNKLNAKIRESEERFRIILNSLPLMVVGLSPSGQITSVNDYGLALSLYSERELLGKSLEQLFSTAGEVTGASTLAGADEPGSRKVETLQLSQRLLRRDGSYLPVELVLSNYAEDGQGDKRKNIRSDKKSIAFVRDVSVREQIEIAKRDFVNMIGHDLRSPLMSLSATLSYISKATNMTSVAEAERVFYNLIALTTDFLYLGKLEAGEAEIDIAQSSYSSLFDCLMHAITANEQTRELALSVNQPPGDFVLSADLECLVQAITHLLLVLGSANFGQSDSRSGQSNYVIDFRYQPEQLEILIVGTDLNLATSILGSLPQGYVAFSQTTGDLRSGLSLGLANFILAKHGASLKQYQNNKLQGFQILLPLI